MKYRYHRALSVTLTAALAIVMLAAFAEGQHEDHQNKAGTGQAAKKRAPEELPRVPPPDARAADVPRGYRVEVAIANLTYPTSVEFDDAGTMYVAEGGYIYGDDVAPARILRVSATGTTEAVAEHLNGPITDLLWHNKRLYISHRGKISVLEQSGVRDLVTGLPSLGDHHNNQLTVGPDGKIYFGQGTATNSGVVGLDNFKMGWLARYPEVHDVPAKDIRLTDQAFETPDPLTLLADKQSGQAEEGKSPSAGQGHEGHNMGKTPANGKEPAGKEHEGHAQGRAPAGAKPPAEVKPPANNKEHEGHEGAKEPAKVETPATDTEPAKGKEHEGHEQAKDSAKAKASAKDGAPAKGKEHEGHAQGKTPANGKEQEGQTPADKDAQTGKGHQGHGQDPMPKGQQAGQGHEGHGAAKSADNGQASGGHAMVKSFAFQPFAKTPPDDGAVRGTVKASGTILRMNPDGSDLEMYAWGLRNPFGLVWGPDGNLYASDNGYDERGSRPIAHAPDCLWLIKQDAWYGFPDYAGGVPVSDPQFHPEHGPIPKFLMRDHPNVERPLLSLTHHVGAAKIDFSPSDRFGFKDQLFLALAGDMNPITGMHEERSGFEVMRIDPVSGEAETFFKAKHEAQGPHSMEYVVTAGPRRPVDVRFSPDGSALYVVDVGAMAIVSTATGPAPRPFPGTGIIWRITRDEISRAAKAPANSERSRK